MASAISSSIATTDIIQNLRITFWGVQGSCPIIPTPEELAELRRDREPLPFYGGDTTCIQVETADGDMLIFDAGSGIRRCSASVVEKFAGRAGRIVHLFGSHEHLDHRSGLPFARFCYGPDPFTIYVYGTAPLLSAIDQRYGLFSHRLSDCAHVDDPIDFSRMSARFVGTELRDPADNLAPGEGGVLKHTLLEGAAQVPWAVRDLSPVQIGQTTVTPFEVYHVIPHCLGYKIERGSRSFIFCTDHELRRGDDPAHPRQQRSAAAESRLIEHCRNADVAYFDGQYFLDEYQGKLGIGSTPAACRLDWGHSCIEDVIDRARRCKIQRTYIGHHDPERPWPQRLDIARKLERLSEGERNRIALAGSDMVVDI